MPFERPPEVTDPKAMRALAHPVRIALLEVLTHADALTATQAGEIVDKSPANASFHLRSPAKYGFVEEAEGGTGRRRPWRRTSCSGMSFTEVHADPETAAAPPASEPHVQSSYLRRAERGLEENRSLPEAWRRVTGWNQMGLYLTPEELGELDSAMVELMFERFGERRRPHCEDARARRTRGDPDPLRTAYEAPDGPPRRPPVPGRPVAEPARRPRAAWLTGLWVKELTGSSSAAGLVFLCIVAPGLLSPLAGLLVDRIRRRTVLIIVNPLTALAVLPLLLVHDEGDVWLIYVVATLTAPRT